MWGLNVLSNEGNVSCVYRFDLGAFSSDILGIYGSGFLFLVGEGRGADLAHNLIYCDVLMSIQ